MSFAGTMPLYAVNFAIIETRVRTAGVPITHEIFSFSGGWHSYFPDPAGNVFAIQGN
jgi:predicted enzyme related to lactoylglutathione lyase